METKKKWYQKTGGIIALLVLFFPVGLYLMWKHASWNKTVKWGVTGVFAFLVLVNAFGGEPTSTTNSQDTTPVVSQETEETTQETASIEEQENEPTTAPAQATNTPAPTQIEAAPTSTETVSQKNALKKAQSYLAYTAFSHDGLVAQLEYEQFSHADAVYGADNVGADWMEQAAKKAQSYMEYSAFSRGSLIEQLKYDKFTQAQAEHGADSVGL